MKIAIGKKELGEKASPELIALNLNANNDVEYFSEDSFDIDYVKKEKVNVVITNDINVIKKIFGSLSIGTSTYVICDRSCLSVNSQNQFFVDDLNNVNEVNDVINQIALNRKPAIEKIWNRHYTDEQLAKEFPMMRTNDFIRSKNIEPSLTALEYFGVKTSYGEYDSDVIEYSKKLAALGVKEGDSVGLCLPNTPETMKIFAAVKERGAICNNIFPLSSADEIEYCLNMMNSKIAFVLDSRYKDLRKIVDKTKLDKAFLITPFESLPTLKVPYDIKQKLTGFRPKNSGYGTFKDFERTKGINYETPVYDAKKVNSVQYTSGTTGKPKAVLLTEDTFNTRAHQYEQVNVGLEKGVRFLQCLPVCGKAYGEFTMHVGLANAACNVLVPKFTSGDLVKLIKRFNIQGLTMPPIAWQHVVDSPEFKTLDLSNFKMATVGGDGAIPKFIEMVQEKLEKQGFKGKVILGSGGTELGVTFSTNTLDVNKPGTSGQIMKGNNCHIIDENGNECGYNEKGIVYYDSVSPCAGYANDGVELKQNEYGVDLGDYGFIDEDGLLTVAGRRSDMILVNGKKISPFELEELINTCPSVKYGYVVKSNHNDKIIRVCYTTYEENENADAHDEIMEILPEELKKVTEIYHLSYIPETAGLKADRYLIASDKVNDLLYKPEEKGRKILLKHGK